MDAMRARQSVDLTAQNDPAMSHRRSVSHVNPGHGRRPSQSLGGAATLELIQAQAANQAQGGDANPVALVNQIAAANNGNMNGPLDPSSVGMLPNGQMNNRMNGIDQTSQGLGGMQLQGMNGNMNGGGYAMNGGMNAMNAMNGMNGMNGMNNMNGMNGINAAGQLRRGRMSTGPGQSTGGYPYSPMAMNGKMPGVNPMVCDISVSLWHARD
jgi:hypothetical protein